MSETTKPEAEMEHVDDFVSDIGFDDTPEMGDAMYARWLLLHWRLPAHMKNSFHRFISKNELFCTYEGKRYRCIGGSRLGDVWLTSNFKRDFGYELRVDVKKCFGWGKHPSQTASPRFK